MRPNQTYSTYLTHISEEIERAQGFLGDMRFEEFVADKVTNYATVRALEIVGEAAKRLADEIQQQEPLVPWR